MTDGTVLGAGLDLVETDRIRDAMSRWGARFSERVFTPAERRYCDAKAEPSLHYAARWAVKESVAKAFGIGFGPAMMWPDIEVIRDEATGAPSVRLSARAGALAAERGIARILISLSHTRHYAAAQAILIGGSNRP